jgi:hypothetical protein
MHRQNRAERAQESDARSTKDPAEDHRKTRAALGKITPSNALQVAARMHLSKQDCPEDRNRNGARERTRKHHHASRGAELKSDVLTARGATTSVFGTRQYFSLTKLNRFRRAWSLYAPLVERLGSLTCERGDLPGAIVFRI